MHHHASVSGSRSSSPAQAQKPIAALVLPAWAIEATAEESLVQPWKAHASLAGQDDPNFAQGPDTIQIRDKQKKVCFSEGSLAA